MKAKKVVVTVLAAAALVTASVFGTMAYLTDKEDVTNTFTVGHVDIMLDEAEYVNGELTGNRTEEGNSYHLIPGSKFVKDPTITLKEGSEDAWVYMGVQASGLQNLIEIYGDEYCDPTTGVFLLQNLCLYENEAGFNKNWEFMSFDGTDTYYFAYKTPVKAGDKVVLFDEIYLPGDKVTNSNIDKLEEVEIVVTGYAVQHDTTNFPTYEEGWVEAKANATNYVQ